MGFISAKTVKMLAVVCCCGLPAGAGVESVSADGGTDMKLTSTAFSEGGMIPPVYTCDGADISPAFAWSGVPGGVKSFALVCDDPDAPVGDWVHWVLYNIPPKVNVLSEKTAATDTLPGGTRQGINDFRKTGYGGPCPPRGVHRYYFRLYALDTLLPPAGNMTKKKLLVAMKGHVIAGAVLMGRYGR
jgi:Raf kinase inhibitor-like YbhB/YbcL family protein